jgi:two-component system, NarL family, invasion response regulator UvrY
MPATSTVKLALVEEHTLFRKGLISLIEMAGDQYQILFEANNIWQLQQKISKDNPPDIIILGIHEPGEMDGLACLQWLKENFPLLKILVVSLIEEKEIIVRILKQGINGYLLSDVEPGELRKALKTIMQKGFYFTNFITGKFKPYAR